MEILNVAYYTALRNLKDIRMLAMLVLAPILLILILGSALDGIIQPREIEQVSVAYLNADPGPAGQGLTAFLQSEQASPYISLVAVESEATGESMLAEGEVTAFVHVPADFTLAMAQGGDSTVHVYSPSSMPLVMAFVQNYTNQLASHQAVVGMGEDFVPSINDFVDSTGIKADGKIPRAIDYFAVQTMLQFMIMGAWYGIGSVQDDRDKNTLVRLYTAPVKQHSIMVGKLLANILVLFLQVVTVLLFTKLVYGANWNGNWAVIAATLLLTSAFSIGLGMLIGTCFKDGNKAFGVLWALMFFFSVVAGAFGKVQPGSALERLAKFSPNFYASKALFGTIFGSNTAMIGMSLFTLLAGAVLTFAMSLSLGRRKAI